MKKKMIYKSDPYLLPYKRAIDERHKRIMDCRKKFLEASGQGEDGRLSAAINNHFYYGMHRTEDGGWVFREWAPNATEMYLVGDFNDWQPTDKYKAKRIQGTGNYCENIHPDIEKQSHKGRIQSLRFPSLPGLLRA